MESARRSTSPCEHQAISKEMSHVHELTSQLHAILLALSPTDPSSSDQRVSNLFDDVFGALNLALSMLPTCSLCGLDGDDGHGRSKKFDSWTVLTTVPHNDGYQWRKYGQKGIAGRRFQRCAHYKDQGCSATKTVQQKDDGDQNPPKYEVTYNMQHKCNSTEGTSLASNNVGSSSSSSSSCKEILQPEKERDDDPLGVFTELELEDLFCTYTQPMDQVVQNILSLEDFSMDIWNHNCDAPLAQNEVPKSP
ncbi:probable WRKY transcription factor 62 isoform X2 [Asparagus officinalis]|uniref:probable WRKY transcription factor 62 isoform X2 n=1 Tax=Asparagus officinalis TaxID=4686 RepID=UPI00098E3318|nr:probable WRKY transcription factor 62 isoform X2 [Asparagus officinalis]